MKEISAPLIEGMKKTYVWIDEMNSKHAVEAV